MRRVLMVLAATVALAAGVVFPVSSQGADVATFAIFYKPADVDAIAAWATNPNLQQGLRTYANRLWNAGLKNWSTAPVAPDAYACVGVPEGTTSGDPDVVIRQNPNGDGSWQACDFTIRLIVISGSQVSKAQTVQWLREVAAQNQGAAYLAALAEDVQATAVEPWTG